jgi:CHAT domain-containing protein/tetratricopeptide (TPR) repeat protein
MTTAPGALDAGAATAQTLAERAAADEQLGQFDHAYALLAQALAVLIASRGEDDAELLTILNRLARVCLRLGRPKDALDYAERALKIADCTFGAESAELARPLAALAEACFALGLLDTCYLAVTRALDIARATHSEDDPETAKASVRLGVVLTELGELAQAIALHQRALAVMRAHGRKDWVAAILVSLAAAQVAAGETVSARPLYEEALATARAHFGDRHPTTAAYLATLAGFLGRTGEEPRALSMYDEALAIMRGALGETHPQVAAALLDKGRLRIRSEPAAGRADVFRALATLGAQQHRPRLFAQGYLLLARMLEPSATAILLRKLAINEIEDMRSHVARLDPLLERTFLRRNEDEFRALGDALICAGRLPEAQQVLAMIKQRELFGLTRIDARSTAASLTELEAQWVARGEVLLAEIKSSLEDAELTAGDPKQQSASLPARIDAAGARLAAWLDDLVAAFAAAEAGAGAVSAPAVPRDLPAPGTALLQYLLAPDRLSLSIILTTADLQREYRAALGAGELNRLVYGMREAVESRSGDFLAGAQRLHQLLIAPVLPELDARGITTLALSLDGVLRYLPIAALHDGTRYLVERFALMLTTGAVVSAQVGQARLAVTETQVGQARLAMRAVGLGVSRPHAGYQPLPGVREELAAVICTDGKSVGVLPGAIRLDDQFTATELRTATAQPNSVIHIASHFVFEAAQEATSYLLLGDGSRLTLAELAQLRFQDIELVVLSACNTAIGGGHRQNGREIEGLGAMVRHQGGHRVLATLWRVADLTTVTVMRSFYRNQFEAALAPPEALRRAQLDLLHDIGGNSAQGAARGLVDPDEDATGSSGTAHPFFWAPYILIGEANER